MPIDKEKAQAKVITGHHNDGTREFNYALEVVIAPRTDLDEKHAGEVEFIGSINSTPSIDGGEGYFQGYPYRWLDKKGNTRDATSVNDILHECGFNTSSYHAAKKRFPSVLAINLRTPVPDWLGSAGKTKIDLKPYADEIAKTVVNLANKIPSYHGKKHTVFNFSFSRETPAIQYLEDFLKERYNKIQANPSLKITDKITQSGVWYRIRPIMVEDNFQPRKTWGDTRKGLTSKINEICQQLFSLNREELGIIAGTRATMLYEGKSYPVEIDNVEELAMKGIAIIIIEKEGIADLLAPFAERYRVALVHTRGRFTEYGKDLIEAAKKAGSVVGILVDYDAYGEEIAKGSRTDTPKIGITRDTVKWLQHNGYPDLTEAGIEEEYSPAIYTSDEYLKTKRIELDSIAAKVGAAGLWKYILHRLQSPEIAPQGFDLNQAVTIPANEVFYPKAVRDSLTYLCKYIDGVLSEEREVIEHELEGVRELTEIESEEKDIEERLRNVIAEDEGMQTVALEFDKLLKRLPKINDEDEE